MKYKIMPEQKQHFSAIRFLKFVLTGLFFIFACAPVHNRIIQYDNGIPINPDIVYGSLSNGFQYILKENKNPEEKINIHLNVFAGSMHETSEQQGIAHYLEHMLFNGSTHFPPGELIKYFQSIGMDFGGDANAHTSFFNTVYDLSLPDNTQKHIDEAFVVVEDYAKGALLLDSEVNRERGVILSEKRQRDSISYRTFKKTLEFELPDSLLNQRFPIGIDKVLKKADSKMLRAYYDHWYRPDNMVLVIAGDFNVSVVESMIINRFDKLKSRAGFSKKTIPLKALKFREHKDIKVFYHHEPEASSTNVTIETISFKPFKAQTLDSLKKEILDNITNSIIQNRLSRMVNKQTADFSHALTYSGTFLHNISLSAINATCEPENWQSVLTQIENILRQALIFGFFKKELARVKSDFISLLEKEVNQAQTQKTKNISRSILTSINKKELFLSEKQKQSLLKPYIESITIQTVHNALKNMWSKDHRLILITGNAKISTKDYQTVILDVFRQSINKKVAEYKSFESKKFPYLIVPSLQNSIKTREDIIISQENIKNTGITKIIFKNGIYLNLKKTDFKKNEFQFKVCFGKGKRSQPVSKPGLSILSEHVVKNSGFGGIDADQLDDALAGQNISISFGIKENYFYLSGLADPNKAELIFQLIFHYFNDPGFSEQALNLAKIRYKQRYETLTRTPDGIMEIKGESFLAENDVRFGLSHPDIILKYTLDDIKTWLMPNFANPEIEISIAGDFEPENILKLAKKYMGNFKQRIKYSNISIKSDRVSFPKGKRLELTIDSKINTGVVRIAFLTDDFWDISQTRRLSILSRVVSERLRILIREELGETYSPYVYNDSSVRFNDYGIMHAVVNIKPERVDFVYNKIKEIIHSLNFEGITGNDIDISLKPVLNHLKIIQKTNSYWLNSVMANSFTYPQKFDWANTMIQDYNSINSDDLNKLIKQYLNIEQSALIIIKTN